MQIKVQCLGPLGFCKNICGEKFLLTLYFSGAEIFLELHNLKKELSLSFLI